VRATVLGAPVHKISDHGGAFRLEGLTPGTLDLVAMAPDGRTAKLKGLSLREGEDRQGLVLVAQGGLTVRGRTVDHETGLPLPGIRVQIELAGNASFSLSDANGVFTLDNVPSLPRLRAVLSSNTHHVEMRVVPTPTNGRSDLGTVRMIEMDPSRPARGRTGARFLERDGKLLVESVEPESPTAKVGFKAGDLVLAIDGQKVSGDPKEAAALLRANPGTEVKVVLQTPGEQPREVRVKRL
jgi:membrane-associated protease RseP (regulator of RpoE activity)